MITTRLTVRLELAIMQVTRRRDLGAAPGLQGHGVSSHRPGRPRVTGPPVTRSPTGHWPCIVWSHWHGPTVNTDFRAAVCRDSDYDALRVTEATGCHWQAIRGSE